MRSDIRKLLDNICPDSEIRQDEPMSLHTTFRAGGSAGYFVTVPDTAGLGKLICALENENIPYFILGNGSNILVGDGGYDGVIIKLGSGFGDIRTAGCSITACAGASLAEVSQKAAEASLTGLEFAQGIPGSVGGAVRMNAGAYDGDMSRIVSSVTVMDRSGAVRVLDGTDMGFGYRTSIIRTQQLIVISTVLELKQGEQDGIRARMAELAEKRRSRQPLEFPSAGSTFKRPEGNFAGKLIMEAGLRGYTVGGAQVSEKHCGFVINKGGATADDIRKLTEDVRDRVYETSGVKLEREVIFIGKF